MPEPLLIIDGSNAVHAVAVSGPGHATARTPAARAKLLEVVASRVRGATTIVTFDERSSAPPRDCGPIVVHTADADEWIVARTADEVASRDVTVVTSDRALSARVAALGAHVERPRAALTAERPR